MFVVADGFAYRYEGLGAPAESRALPEAVLAWQCTEHELSVICEDGSVYGWEGADWELLWRVEWPGTLEKVAISADGNFALGSVQHGISIDTYYIHRDGTADFLETPDNLAYVDAVWISRDNATYAYSYRMRNVEHRISRSTSDEKEAFEGGEMGVAIFSGSNYANVGHFYLDMEGDELPFHTIAYDAQHRTLFYGNQSHSLAMLNVDDGEQDYLAQPGYADISFAASVVETPIFAPELGFMVLRLGNGDWFLAYSNKLTDKYSVLRDKMDRKAKIIWVNLKKWPQILYVDEYFSLKSID
ncbi:MAG: hypothetical protein AAF570_06655, partial [Bacteroidota bacterium]